MSVEARVHCLRLGERLACEALLIEAALIAGDHLALGKHTRLLSARSHFECEELQGGVLVHLREALLFAVPGLAASVGGLRIQVRVHIATSLVALPPPRAALVASFGLHADGLATQPLLRADQSDSGHALTLQTAAHLADLALSSQLHSLHTPLLNEPSEEAALRVLLDALPGAAARSALRKSVLGCLETDHAALLSRSLHRVSRRRDWFAHLFVTLSQWRDDETSAAALERAMSECRDIDVSYVVWALHKLPCSVGADARALSAHVSLFVDRCALASLCRGMGLVLLTLLRLAARAHSGDQQRARAARVSQVSESPLPSCLSSRSRSDSDLSEGRPDGGRVLAVLGGFVSAVCSRGKAPMVALFWALVLEGKCAAGSSCRQAYLQYLNKALLESIRAFADRSGDTSAEGVLAMRAFIEDALHCLRALPASATTETKQAEFRALLSARTKHYFGAGERCMLSPMCCDTLLLSVDWTRCVVFSSSKAPVLIEFTSRAVSRPSELKPCRIILKQGDDLGVDRLALALLSSANNLLLSVGLDLRVKLYEVLPTGPLQGCIESLDAEPLASLSKRSESVLDFLQANNPDAAQDMGVTQSALASFVRSCAFHCVLTYVLGVGDRHLDNILLCRTGHVVHIDFSFLFGSDPKVSSSLMRLTRPMIDAMGGEPSRGFEEFQKFCCLAYNTLRRFSGEMLFVIASYVDAGLPCVGGRENRKAIDFVQERLRLQLLDDDAAEHICSVIRQSVGSFIPDIIECAHYLAVSQK